MIIMVDVLLLKKLFLSLSRSHTSLQKHGGRRQSIELSGTYEVQYFVSYMTMKKKRSWVPNMYAIYNHVTCLHPQITIGRNDEACPFAMFRLVNIFP